MTLGMQQHEPQRDTQWTFSQTHLLLTSDFENDQTTVRYQIVSKGDHDVPVPAEPPDDSRTGWVIVFPIAAGLLALFFFLSIGGLFAIIAPWVILAGIQSAMKRTGWQFLGILTGVAFIALGVAAFLLPIHGGSWDSRLIAGLMGVIGGSAYTGFMLWEMRK